jgi:DNA-binding response OmpR family regulator
MQCIIITNHPLHAQPLHSALKRLNIDSICARPNALKNWAPETDALIFVERLHPMHYPTLDALIDELSSDMPLIFLKPLSRQFSSQYRAILDRCIVVDETLELDECSHMIVDVMSSVFSHYHDEITCGPLTLNRRFRRVEVLGRRIPLTRKEFYLLELLARNIGRTTTRERIISYVWDKRQFVNSNTLDVYISRIRKKLAIADFSPKIQTVPCIGYSLQIQTN